ncbi:prepilin-type N-terminal cleavage/methylation domain-containing protein [Lignipirellula cremea]|uniref:Type II secretion system protein G n=1 Tax=Lignipirellula cremea TaxID=2528010 RepID=A0A518DTG9_9BACT|nr:prepilin-type N-terminal cleavage/methylation domain-containing protein [Lignipirellula cremea]QDU95135.1 Type II secretion system protein G precursor [Lignipirellula cremea]
MKSKKASGFTLVEVLIVVVIMAVLAATIIPQFSDSANDAKEGTSEFNLHTIRSQIELYKSQHDGLVPSDLSKLTEVTDEDGTVGAGADFKYGPYIRELPVNSFTNLNTVTTITNSPAQAGDVTGASGWLYNATTGTVFIDHADHFEK